MSPQATEPVNPVVASIRAEYALRLEDSGRTHYEGCWKMHWPCAIARLTDEIERLCKLLNDCADPVSCQLAEARNNLALYKGYSSRERRYGYEIAELERLQKEIGNG